MVEIAPASAQSGNTFPVSAATTFTGTQSAVVATTNSTFAVTTGFIANKVTVTGLSDSTAYVYRVGDGNNWSPAYTIHTKSQSSFGFIAYGDPQIGAGANNASDTAGWVNSVKAATSMYPNASFILNAGDEVNDTALITNQDAQYQGYFSPSQLSGIPVATVNGNHDFSMGQYYGYHYNVANLSASCGISFGNDGDYRFVYGNTLFIILNSNTESVTTHGTFIAAAVAAYPNAKWRIVSFHHSIYSEATHMNDTDIIARRSAYPPVFENNGIDVVISGHDHSYTRSYQMLGGTPTSSSNATTVNNPTGILYLTLNSGSGSKYYQFIDTTNETYSAYRWQGNDPSFTYFSINGGTFTMTVYRVDTMALIDQYTITKN
jgi:predicted phosphodiesterase